MPRNIPDPRVERSEERARSPAIFDMNCGDAVSTSRRIPSNLNCRARREVDPKQRGIKIFYRKCKYRDAVIYFHSIISFHDKLCIRFLGFPDDRSPFHIESWNVCFTSVVVKTRRHRHHHFCRDATEKYEYEIRARHTRRHCKSQWRGSRWSANCDFRFRDAIPRNIPDSRIKQHDDCSRYSPSLMRITDFSANVERFETLKKDKNVLYKYDI